MKKKAKTKQSPNPLRCSHINRLPIVWRHEVLGAASVGQCEKDALPGMVKCEDHTPVEAMAYWIKTLHKRYVEATGKEP